jgi:uncharacterized protein (TIGR03118 family)
MRNNFLKVTILSLPTTVVFLLSFTFFLTSCKKKYAEPDTGATDQSVTAESLRSKDPKSLKDFVQVNLVGNNSEYHPRLIDANLINAWGISFPTSGPAWVSANGTGLSFLFLADGTQPRVPVNIPGAGTSPMGHPTGQAFNAGPGFRLPNGNPARFIFASDDGSISGWNGGNNAIRKVDDSPDASYLGLTIANDGSNTFLYVANFSEREIDVYDTAWKEVSRSFTDPHLPHDYSPFNIQNVDGKLYVMYAKVGPGGDEIHHEGFGVVDIFNPNGSFVKRFVTFGQLNAPWGIAHPPAGFWGDDDHKGDNHGDDNDNVDAILIGNFGDGRINAFSPHGDFLGQLRSHGKPIKIDGLWGLGFPPSTSTVLNPNWLFFAAGPDDEKNGLFGYISK